ncbi:MAG: amidase family protein, partial [Halobacteria archaeon]|nr:amidase family protein [Halobacteria archaeon]
ADKVRTDVYRAVEEIFEEYDVLVSPTINVLPFDKELPGPSKVDGESINPYLSWFSTWLYNMTGHPVASAPAGFDSEDGLPVGIQIAAPMYEDDTVISASSAFERERPWQDAYPPR